MRKTPFNALAKALRAITLGAAALSVLGSVAGAAEAATPFPLGAYTGNPNGNSSAAEQQFEQQFNSFVSQMGARPAFMNAFVDYTQDPSQWASNASWTAWSWAISPVIGTSITPVIGVPMASNAGGWGQVDTFYRAVVNGTYDADFAGVVDAWAGQGFRTFYLRLGYEFDGSFMAWYAFQDASTPGLFVAAFQHLATLMRAEAQKHGATALIVWNPTFINWTADSVPAVYPGDDYVDVIGLDAYNTLYPLDLTDWISPGFPVDSSQAVWQQKPGNRQHFWNYPSANQWNHHGQVSGNPAMEYTGWGMNSAIAFAKQHGKPLAIPESGAGLSAQSNNVSDDAAFPKWLARELRSAASQGVSIAFVDIWDSCMGDGCWAFTAPGNAGALKPAEAAAWAKNFGAQ